MENQLLDTDLQTTPPQYKDYAGFWQRFSATFIDSLILSVVGLLVLGAFGINFMDLYQAAIQGAKDDTDPTELFGTNYMIASFVSLCIRWYYFAQQESSEHKATLGKRVVGLVVTDLQGQRLSFQQASVRFVMKEAYSIIPLFGSLVGAPAMASILSLLAMASYLMQPFTAKKQALHDIIAKTLVYQR